jgi:ParB/RepB/Spo0J family partition protein
MRIAIEYRPIGMLKLDPRNARLHSEAQVDEIAASIKRFGFFNPVLVREDGSIVAGEGRYRAARKLDMADVPVIELCGLSDAQYRALALADNRIALNAVWDAELLASELAALTAAGEATGGLGFDKDELAAMMAPADEDARVETINVSALDDRFWIAVRGPMKDQAHALLRIQQVMAEFPAIEVELGTIGMQD